jgi:hypothetical protein
VEDMKACMEKGGMAPLIFSSILNENEWTASRSIRFTTGKEHSYQLNKILGGHHKRFFLTLWGRKKYLASSEKRSPD